MQSQYQTAITSARGDKFAPDSTRPGCRVETVEKRMLLLACRCSAAGKVESNWRTAAVRACRCRMPARLVNFTSLNGCTGFTFFSRKKKTAQLLPQVRAAKSRISTIRSDKDGTLAEEWKGSSGLDHPNNGRLIMACCMPKQIACLQVL